MGRGLFAQRLSPVFDLKRRCAECVWHQSTARAIREQMYPVPAADPYAFESLSRYFDVIHWSFCSVPLQVEHTQALASANCYWFTFLKKITLYKLNIVSSLSKIKYARAISRPVVFGPEFEPLLNDINANLPQALPRAVPVQHSAGEIFYSIALF